MRNLLWITVLLSSTPGAQDKIDAKVVYVDAKNGFIAIDKGKKAGVGSDFEYDVVRQGADGDVVIGKARFEKYLGARELMAKLIVEDGTVPRMRVEDRVIGRRKG